MFYYRKEMADCQTIGKRSKMAGSVGIFKGGDLNLGAHSNISTPMPHPRIIKSNSGGRYGLKRAIFSDHSAIKLEISITKT